MHRVLTTSVCVVVALGVATGCGGQRSVSPAADEAAIATALYKWPRDFNNKNLSEVCGLFAEGVVLVYPDSPDRDHDAFCQQMRGTFEDSTKRFHYHTPEIKQILVDGDLAAVRLVWTLTVTDSFGMMPETTREDGVDVLRRQPDGSWKIAISHAFPQV